uniref:EGF-like domain-containing protein n=1 Tax=Plectus sambesii TaxID=2011161 RepID=A0A914W1H4_9BILA
MRVLLVPLLAIIILLISWCDSQDPSTLTPTIIHFCDKKSNPCGSRGTCQEKRTGNRCKCQKGWMGIKCQRPCQDVYRSCERWKEEDRCSWAHVISPWFEDNCAQSCETCAADLNNQLQVPLAPILEPLAWLVGQWETTSSSKNHFPIPMLGPYTETMDIRLTAVPMFDRPPLNFSSRATTTNGQGDVHVNVGFITSKPFDEDTGFIDVDKPKEGDDLVALEMNSNTGINTIEEGIMKGMVLKLNATFNFAYYGMEQRTFKSVGYLSLIVYRR